MPKPKVRDLDSLAAAHARPATDVKTSWRDIVDDANAYGEVVVTNYNRPEVVVLSIDQYLKMKNDAVANDPLAKVWEDLDRELAVFHDPDSGRKLRRAFASTPREMAAAANEQARRRKR